MSAPVPDVSAAPALARALASAHYNQGGIGVALGTSYEASPSLVPAQARRFEDDDLGTLARVFLLGVPQPAERVGRALGSLPVDDLVAAGFLVAEGDEVRSPIRITPHDEVLLAHDPDPGGFEEPAAEIVTGLNGAALTLASLFPRLAVGRVLDIGTGNGVQALLAAVRAEHVVATDVNPRSLEFTRLSAALSGLDNVETREGSFFDPVEGERFDLIVSNPPYVISPDADLVYRDGGLEGDEVSRLALTGAIEHLAPDGYAVLLLNWVSSPFGDWAQTLEGWLEGSEVTAVLLHHLTEDALDYAAKWNTRHWRDARQHGEVIDRWLASYEDQGIMSLSTGAVAVHRPEAATGRAIARHQMATGPAGSAGRHTLRLLAAAELLASVDEDTLMQIPLSLVEEHRMIRELEHGAEGYGAETVRLVLADNVGLHSEFGPLVAGLVLGIDGQTTGHDLLGRVVEATGAQLEDARPAVVEAVRTLVSQGFVVPSAAVADA